MKRLALLLVVGVATILPAQEPRQSTWTFTRIDQVAGLKTEVLGNPKLIDTPLGKAIRFNGVDDAVYVPVHPLAGAKTFTWEVIFRPASGGNPEQRFFHLAEQDPQTGADTNVRLLFETRLIDGKWCLDSFVFSKAGSKPLLDRTKLHSLDQFHHIAMVFDGTEFRHYVDHQLQGSAPLAYAPQGAGHTSMGTRINKQDFFKGYILLSRTTPRALSVSEFLPVPKN
jgi:hypothetical protein